MSRRSVFCLAALAMMAACDKESTIVQVDHSDAAAVTFVNATLVSARLFAGGTDYSTITLPSFSWQSACAFVPPGSTSVEFKDLGGIVYGSATANLTAGQRYTAILLDNGTAKSVLVLPETFATLTPGNYGVRIVNASGQSADFYVTTPTAAVSGTPTASLALNEVTGGAAGTNAFLAFPITSPRVRMYNTGNTTTALASISLDATSLSTNVNWTQGVTAVFAKNASNVMTAFTAGQCM